MAIDFLCPNGHRLSSPDTSAGLPGKCPRCQAIFRVPRQAGVRASPSDSAHSLPLIEEAESLSARTNQTMLGIGTGASRGNGTIPSDSIVFLCPNGHKLNGPTSLQGKAGQCPHCGARFIIPSPDDAADDDHLEVAEDEPELGLLENVNVPAESHDDDLQLLEEVQNTNRPTRIPGQVHPMAAAFGRVWDQRNIGRTVELFTHDGAKITCERFRGASVNQPAGVFAARDEAGSLAIVTVAWDAVSRVMLRGVRELPGGMFE